jgi:hypothetical protein
MLPKSKTLLRVLDTQATAGETNTYSFDRRGFDYVTVKLGLMGTETTDPPTVITLTHSDDNTTFSAITNFVAGTDFTIPTAIRTLGAASDAGPTVVLMRVDARDKKRYFKLTCNSATKMTQVVNVDMDRAKTAPSTAALAGVDVLATV